MFDRVVDRTFSVVGGVVQNEFSVTATTVKEYECRVSHPRLEDDLATYHTLQGLSSSQSGKFDESSN